VILSELQAEILDIIGFTVAAILKIQNGSLNIHCESGSWQKLKAGVIYSMYKKFGAFVQHVIIQALICLTRLAGAENKVLYFIILHLNGRWK